MLLINNDVVREVLTMSDCIRSQEEAFAKQFEGSAIHRGRVDMYFPCDREVGYFRWGTMEGANGEYFAIRMKSDIITWPKDAAGNWTDRSLVEGSAEKAKLPSTGWSPESHECESRGVRRRHVGAARHRCRSRRLGARSGSRRRYSRVVHGCDGARLRSCMDRTRSSSAERNRTHQPRSSYVLSEQR